MLSRNKAKPRAKHWILSTGTEGGSGEKLRNPAANCEIRAKGEHAVEATVQYSNLVWC
jgi:hypothetical protein